MKSDEGACRANLITIGRKTGNLHEVELRAVFYKNRFYFSRRNPNSDWLKNAQKTPSVKIRYQKEIIRGNATLLVDEELCKKISKMKYADKRAEEARVVLEVIPDE